jgi:hypothetical protein
MGTLRDDIADLVHLYADAVVHRDGAQWGSTWAGDASWNLGRGRKVEGRDAIVDLWHKAMGGFTAVVQMVANGMVREEAPDEQGRERASGRWYIFENFQRSDGTAGILLAFYDDEYVKVDGRWHFASRELTPQYQGPPGLSVPFLNAVVLPSA